MYALTANGSKYIDEYTIKRGMPSAVLMENASRSVVSFIEQKFPSHTESILVMVGSGNNGGDGVCVARWLLRLGYEVNVYFVGNPKSVSKGFSTQIKILTSMFPNATLAGFGESGDMNVLDQRYDCIVDGLFGTGLNRKLGYTYVKFLEYVNSKQGYKVAIDIPSGLNATTGDIMESVFWADATVTFGSYKTGMFFGDGREACGEIVVADIGLDEKAYDSIKEKFFICDTEFYESTRHDVLVSRKPHSHKGTYGTVGVVVGADSMHGAAMLVAKAAYRSGCGLVKIFCHEDCAGFFNLSVPEAVVVPYGDDNMLQRLPSFLSGVTVSVIGPGLGESPVNADVVKCALGLKCRVVFDAGAIRFIAQDLKAFKRRSCRCVLTPHIAEMASLCHVSREEFTKNRVLYTKKFSEKLNVTMVVKDDVSMISLMKGTSQRLFLNIIGNAGLATAGTGDVLAGTIGSLIAQGNGLNTSLLYGIMAHSRTAEKLGDDDDIKRRVMAGDIAENIFK